MRQWIKQEDFSSRWREIVRSLYPHIEAKPAGDKVALKLQTFMKNNLQTIRRLVDRAEQLAQTLQNKSHQLVLCLVLCHSDIHGGNVLMDNDNAIYIVDWDAPVMAPKERDLMFIGGGVANIWNKPHEETLFYTGYGQVEINRAILAYYRHERIVEDIAEYGQELLLTTQGSTENRLEMYQHFITMFESEGVIDIAFKTGWSRFWDNPTQYRNHHTFPSVSAETAILLLSRDIVGLGIDTLSPDRPEDGYPVHRIVLGAGRYIVENVAISEQLPPTGSFIIALPLKIRQATEASMRLIGLLP